MLENLLHYVWQHRLFPLGTMHTAEGQKVEVIDPGLHNFGAGPDFFNAKVSIDGQMWVGNVEIHLRATDWYRHHHDTDEAYNNVILHVVGQKDCDVRIAGTERTLPTLELSVPEAVEANYRELLAEEAYPPCYRIIPQLSRLQIHSWMSALTVERVEAKTERIGIWLERTHNDWERTLFVMLARAFGFGNNSDTFERWAETINPQHICKHRDNAFQVLAFFLGQGGFLPEEESGNKGISLAREYKFLKEKFDLTPLPRSAWKMGRLRPQNFPQVRLAQLAELYHSCRLDFSLIRQATTLDELRSLLSATALSFDDPHGNTGGYTLSQASIDLLIVNVVVPLLFAYGRQQNNDTITERAFELLEALPPERNFITRSWALAGITSQHAADSQALIQLRTRYCDRKDCLRCRFGAEYLRKSDKAKE